MKKTPNDYVDMLIEQYMQLKQKETLGWSGMNDKMAIQCAINDVQNTTDVLVQTDYLPHNIDYYTEVLEILKSKL